MAGNITYFIISLFGMIVVFTILNFIILIMVRKNISWQYIIIAGFLYSVSVLGLWILAGNGFNFEKSLNVMKQEAVNEYEMALEIEAAPDFPPEMKENYRKVMKYLVVYSYPAQIIVRLLFIVFLNYFVVRLFVIKQHRQENSFLPFYEWHADERAAWVLVASLLMFVAGDMAFESELLKITALNMLLVLWFFYLVIGFSLVGFIMRKYKLKWMPQAVIYVLIFIAKWPVAIMVLTAIIDTWFNFRKIGKRR